MSANGVVLFPVPHGATVQNNGETQVSTQYLQDYINSHTVVIEETDTGTENGTVTTPVEPGV